jgi:pimeloyl-[acyl-carrier protein] methyl ester esterase
MLFKGAGNTMPNYTTSDGTSIYFTSEGTGDPVVFLHGWSLCGGVWESQRDELSTDYRCIIPDLRGHGNSSQSCTGYGMKEFSTDLEELFEHLDLNEVTLVCWSFSTAIAMSAIPSLRRRLSAVVFVAGSPKFCESDDFPCALTANAIRGLTIKMKRNYQEALQGFFQLMFTPEEATGEEFDRIKRDFHSSWRMPSQYAALKSLETLAVTDMRDILPSIKVPVHLIHGENDPICLPGASRYMAEKIPSATLTILESTGHAPMMSHATCFNGVLRRFLERVYGRD